jgi:metacaspase-1
MTTGLSLHIGLNRIDPAHYGTDGKLGGCVNDARSMHAIATSRGFQSTLLLDEQATSARLLTWLESASQSAKPGDIVFVSYAGHGSQVTDTNNPTEPDGKDETWCLFDRMVVDDELARAWSRFQAGVRILLISDSCHSATVARQLLALSEKIDLTGILGGRELRDLPLVGTPFGDNDVIRRYRVLPDEVSTKVELTHRALYDAIQGRGPSSEDAEFAATLISMSACQDDETAGDGDSHGVFTRALLDAWADGRFQGGYAALFTALKGRISGTRQNPNYHTYGRPSASFESQAPFSITASDTPKKEKTMPENEISIEDRVDAIVRGGTSARQHMEGPLGGDFCHMELRVPRQAVLGKSDQEVYDFLQQNGVPVLLKGFIAATSVKVLARPVEGGLSCHAETNGNHGCEAHVSIRF